MARLKSLVLVLIAFVAGMAVNQWRTAQAEPARDGNSNIIFEIMAAGSPTGVYTQPDLTNTEQIDILRWGDRVMWDGISQQNDAQGNRWIRVAIAEGQIGWMVANLADNNVKIRGSSATYTTPGMAVGKTVTVTQDGDQANFRSEPTTIPGVDNILRLVTVGETLTVVAGPYQAEYFIWWQYQDAAGQTGWIVDIEGWFQVTN